MNVNLRICKCIALLALSGLVSCSKPEKPADNPLKASVIALEKANALQGQLIEQAEAQKRVLEAAEK
jgi:hypothetical protein